MRFLIAAFAALAFASAAGAADIENAHVVELGVRGSIAQHCDMGKVGDMHFGDLTRPGLEVATRVALSCNVPFTMTIKAQHGGLANENYPGGQGPYAGTLPYTIGIALPLRRPQPALVERSFPSRELTGGRSVSTGGAIAVDGMALTVSLGTPSGDAGLLAGNYGETIEITVTPS
jgi:spore coat protein U-like protein